MFLFQWYFSSLLFLKKVKMLLQAIIINYSYIYISYHTLNSMFVIKAPISHGRCTCTSSNLVFTFFHEYVLI